MRPAIRELGRAAIPQALLCVAAAVSGDVLYNRFFAGRGHLPALLLAAVFGGLAGLLASLRRSLVAAVSIAIAGFVVLATEVLYRSTTASGFPTRSTAVALGEGITHAWGRMLSVALPADPNPDLLLLPVLLSWLAAFLATALTRWSTSVLAPATPLLVAFVVGLLLVASQPHTHTYATSGFLVATATLALLRADWVETGSAADPPRQHAGEGRTRTAILTGRLTFTVPIVALVVAAGVSASARPLASARPRFDPRTVDPPPLQVEEAVTPLATIKSQLRLSPPRRLFTVRAAGAVSSDRIRTAVLDRFDGAVWTTNASFLVCGHALLHGGVPAGTRPVSLSVVVDKLGGPFLPTVGQPTGVRGAAVASGRMGFDRTSGMLVTNLLPRRGFSYQLDGMLAARDARMVIALPKVFPDDLADLELPAGMPEVLHKISERLTDVGRTPYEKLHAIELYLRALPYSLDAPPGHSYGSLARMVSGGRQEDAAGYSEQHAALFAILARAEGFPARVAVGYLLRQQRAGIYTVTTKDAHAWPEVYFDGLGWMPFEPTDTRRLTGDDRNRQDNPPVAGQDLPPPSQIAPPAAEPLPGRRGRPGEGIGALRATLLAWAVVAGLGLVGVAATMTAKAARRRRRRHARTAAARVSGAWWEAADRLTEAGFAPPLSATQQEVARLAREAFGTAADPVADLAPLATAAAYSGQQPPEAVTVSAWRLERELNGRLTAGRLRILRRVKHAVDPRPLLSTRQRDRRALRRVGAG